MSIGLGAVLVMAGCGIIRAGNQAAPPATSQQAASSPPTATATATTQCVLGYEVGTQTFPDSPSGYTAALSANAGYTPHTAAQVTITNSGAKGFTLNSYTIEIDYQGTAVVHHQLDAGPTFLAPGDSFDCWIDLSQTSNPVYVSESDYQDSTCRVVNWQQLSG